MGFVWAVCDREVVVVRAANQRGEEKVGCVGRVFLFDCEGQGECHGEVQEGAFCSSLGDPAAWLQEGAEASSSADRVLAGADVAGGEVVEDEVQAFPHREHRLWGIERPLLVSQMHFPMFNRDGIVISGFRTDGV